MDGAVPADLLEGEQASSPADGNEGDLGLRNHPIAFTRTDLTDTSAFPARVHGRVFFSIGVEDFSCSGTVVTTPAQNAVLTAGHCVFDAPPPPGGGTGFVDNWAFVPGFRDPDGMGGNPPEMPFGTFDANTLLAPVGWTSAGSLAFDFAGALLAPDASGNPVERVVGSRGIAFNQRRNQAYRSYGYPADPLDGFDGSRLFACDSRYGGDAPVATTGPLPMGLGCDMTGGASGGGWVAQNRFVESVNSFVLPSHPDVLYGPHLEIEARTLYGSGAGLGGWRCRSLTPTIVGTSAGETIVGTSGPDVIFAGAGNDVVKAGGKKDIVCGGAGRDRLKGGKGPDRLFGQKGPDRLFGGKGRDLCHGGPGRDRAAGCEIRRAL